MEQKSGKSKWQQLWHFSESCTEHPTRNFITCKDVPPTANFACTAKACTLGQLKQSCRNKSNGPGAQEIGREP